MYYCPRCKAKTLKIKNDMLICEKCGFAVSVEVLQTKTICITPEDIEKRLPLYLKSRVIKLLRTNKLVFVKKFVLETGREVFCLEPRSIRDEEALEVLRQIEVLLS